MSWFRWRQGRQGTGYRKLLLVTIPGCFDLYLLHYPTGSHVGPHVDPAADGKKHYRCNVFLWNADRGGEFELEGQAIVDTNRIQVFRPDTQTHRVTRIEKGQRWVLSLGWLRPA